MWLFEWRICPLNAKPQTRQTAKEEKYTYSQSKNIETLGGGRGRDRTIKTLKIEGLGLVPK